MTEKICEKIFSSLSLQNLNPDPPTPYPYTHIALQSLLSLSLSLSRREQMDRSPDPNRNGAPPPPPSSSSSSSLPTFISPTSTANESPASEFFRNLSPLETRAGSRFNATLNSPDYLFTSHPSSYTDPLFPHQDSRSRGFDTSPSVLETPAFDNQSYAPSSPYLYGHYTDPNDLDAFDDRNIRTRLANLPLGPRVLDGNNNNNLNTNSAFERESSTFQRAQWSGTSGDFASGTFQHNHGTRRQLQFGTDARTNSNGSSSFNGLSRNTINVRPHIRVANFSSLLSPNVGEGRASSSQLAVNSVQYTHSQTMNASSDVFGSRHRGGGCFAEDSNTSFSSSVCGETSNHVNNYQQERPAVIEARSLPLHPVRSTTPYGGPLHLTLNEQPILPCGSMLPWQDIDRVDESYQESPKRKRLRATNTTGGKGCKCKKSGCRRLYCECYGAGEYCSEDCACEDCRNHGEYAMEIIEEKAQVQARNPQAFVPKVVMDGTDSPANTREEGTKASAKEVAIARKRHKRGCYCKRSKCEKKYCECFQANVGCSSRCRCEGCENKFGKRPETMNCRAEVQNNPSNENMYSLMDQIDVTETGTRNTNQSSTREVEAMSCFTTPIYKTSVERSSIETTSSPSDGRDFSTVSRSKWHPGNHLHEPSATGFAHQRSRLHSLTPQSNRSNTSFGVYGGLQDIMHNAIDQPEHISNPIDAVQATPPNQREVFSSQQLQSNRPSSSSLLPDSRTQRKSSSSPLPGSRTQRKLVLKNIPPFGSLTP
ncbi:Lin-54-like protein [Trema orientale]|uniref:Lin-54-like protein n=1 Tax=Trema orientale TaxID=63057 RepID=A0A2P5EV24_TREOI|nr:Lin-54-like protein [Trema orientale]